MKKRENSKINHIIIIVLLVLILIITLATYMLISASPENEFQTAPCDEAGPPYIDYEACHYAKQPSNLRVESDCELCQTINACGDLEYYALVCTPHVF
jgi:hypothetical protein